MDDGSVWGRDHGVFAKLEAKDLDFTHEFARCLGEFLIGSRRDQDIEDKIQYPNKE